MIYKFTLKKDYSINLPFKAKDCDCRWLSIKDNTLTVKAGYSWDGGSPKIKIGKHIIGMPDFDSTYEATLVHDALYQFRKQHTVTQFQADFIFLQLLVAHNFRAGNLYYLGVRLFGWIWWLT